jgi:FKBP-type peptidyl-prolyl cis-trans isomerase
MKKNKFVYIAALSLFAAISFNATHALADKKKKNTESEAKDDAKSMAPIKFKTTPNGLDYCIVNDVPGATTAKVGDFVEMHIHAHVGDSMLFDSRKMNNSNPVSFQLANPNFKGDPAEGFLMLSAGDSGVFRVAVDSIRKLGGKLPEYMLDGMKIVYEVVMVSIKSPEQKKAEDEAKAGKQKEIDDKLLQEYFAKNHLKPTRTETGLYYLTTKEGKGNSPENGQTVVVNYTGKTIDGKTFDSNVDTNFHHASPFSFAIGKGQVIRGWDEGVYRMKKGEKTTLYIPSTLAYGERSPSPLIPANGILIFDVEVTDIEADADAPSKEIPKKQMNLNKGK